MGVCKTKMTRLLFNHGEKETRILDR
uniref:Uncharacterized protein n=1 Tax=Anguilla anguilla TaxID=7936 RepID=A0A0E9V3D4_ANGAN